MCTKLTIKQNERIKQVWVKFQSAKSITLFKSLKRSKCLIQISWFYMSKIEYFDIYIYIVIYHFVCSTCITLTIVYIFLSSLKRKPLPPHFFIVCFIIIDFEVLMFLWGRVYSNVRVCHILKLILLKFGWAK